MAAGRLNFSLVVIFVAYVVELKVNQRLTRHPALPVEEDYMYMLYIDLYFVQGTDQFYAHPLDFTVA